MPKEFYKAGAYIRLSREDGNKFEESNSIKNQRELIKEFIDKQDDITIYEYYSDDGMTGTNFDRPGFQKMIKDLYDKKIDCIIVKDLSRFGRNYIEVGRYIDYIFPSLNTRFISIVDSIDNVKNPESLESVVVPFKNLMNDEYCRDISRKIKKVKEIQRLNGEVTNNAAPYGYKTVKRKYVIDEDVKDIVTSIFDMYLSGESTTQIAFKLNEEKVDTPKTYSNKKNGRESNKQYYWSSSLITAMLSNRVYCGDLVQGKTTTLSHKVKVSVAVPKEQWVITENAHEPIIDKVTFDQVQALKSSRTTTKGIKKNTYNTEFKGYLKCIDCKKNMVKMNCNTFNDKKYINFECYTHRRMSVNICESHKITYKELKELVLERIREDVNYLMEFEKNGISKFFKNDELDNIRKTIKETEERINELYDMKNNILYDLKKELITKDDYAFYSDNYEQEIKLKNKELNDLKSNEFMLSHEEVTIKEFLKKFKKYYNLTEITENVLKDLINTIYITTDRDIVIKYLDNEVFELIRKKGEIPDGEKQV